MLFISSILPELLIHVFTQSLHKYVESNPLGHVNSSLSFLFMHSYNGSSVNSSKQQEHVYNVLIYSNLSGVILR